MSDYVGKILYIFKRLREPSTHASISALLALVGVNIPDATWSTVVNGVAVLFGIAGVFVKEGKPETEVEGF